MISQKALNPFTQKYQSIKSIKQLLKRIQSQTYFALNPNGQKDIKFLGYSILISFLLILLQIRVGSSQKTSVLTPTVPGLIKQRVKLHIIYFYLKQLASKVSMIVGLNDTLTINHITKSHSYLANVKKEPTLFQNIASENQDQSSSLIRPSFEYQDDSEDSAVSLEENILDEHLHCAKSKIQTITDLLFKATNIDVLLRIANSRTSLERKPFSEYMYCLKRRSRSKKIKFIIHSNFYKFMEEIYQLSSELLVYELVSIALHVAESFNPPEGIWFTMAELKKFSTEEQLLRSVCQRQSLKVFKWQRLIREQSSYDEATVAKIRSFLEFFIFTCLLVKQNYFINPSYQEVKQAQQKKNKKKRREKLFKYIKLAKRIRKNSNKQNL